MAKDENTKVIVDLDDETRQERAITLAHRTNELLEAREEYLKVQSKWRKTIDGLTGQVAALSKAVVTGKEERDPDALPFGKREASRS